MGAPTSLLGQVRAFARDFPRDRMPPGYLWDIADYVPALMDATLTGRGGWLWGSTVLDGFEAQNGILATFSTGDRLLVAAAATLAEHGRFYEVSQNPPYTATDFGPAAPCLQNLVQLGDEVISVEEDGLDGPQVITVNDDNTLRITTAWMDEHPPRRAVVYKSMLVTAAARPPLASLEELRTVRFSIPVERLLDASRGANQETTTIISVGTPTEDGSGTVSLTDPVTKGHPKGATVTVTGVRTTSLALECFATDTAITVTNISGMAAGQTLYIDTGQNLGSYDINSFIRTSHEVTGLAALRTMLIVFHRGSTERIRGATPPRSPPVPLPADDQTDYKGDMWLEPLFDDIGCLEPKTIAYYNDSVLFANERGLFLTDGATVTNLASEGGIRSYWRQMYTNRNTLAGAVFLDYYILTVTRSDGTDTTLVCDIPRRQWFRFTNVPALTYISSKSTANVERLWAGLKGTHRLARIGPCFFPDLDVALISDDNGAPVLPSFETPWYRLAEEGRKRVRFAYLSYDARLPAMTPTLEIDYLTSPQGGYTSAGSLPATDEYSRFRLPVGKFPYGVAFRVKQLQATRALRIFDLGVETQAGERSRV